MSGIQPVAPIGVEGLRSLASLAVNTDAQGLNFASMLQGLQSMESKIAKADEMVKQFAVDDNVPVHQVTYALEEARLSVELAMQVRTRLVEAYRDLMNMQL